jgi:DNA-binding NtrC family response regulator
MWKPAVLVLGSTVKEIPLVLVTSNGSEQLAMQACGHGIKAYLRTPFSVDDLRAVLLPLSPSHAGKEIGRSETMVGQSEAVGAIRGYLRKVAPTMSNVLITGETGTGKELIAELIHNSGPRRDKPMICVNCAAIPDTLLESELFGHERGAFTGAHAAQEGKLKLADGGTLFLDEIGDMSPYAQAKVLRVLESKQVQRLGSRKTQHVDFRLIAATNRELDALIKEDKFRQDLFFRINVARIHLPPLRDRREDILPLAHFFRNQYNRKFELETTSFTAGTEEILVSHDWPGNIRELKNTIEAAFINAEPGATQVGLPVLFCQVLKKKEERGAGEVERILLALSETSWNRSKAAEKLHWSRMTLYRKMSRYQIPRSAKDISSRSA